LALAPFVFVIVAFISRNPIELRSGSSIAMGSVASGWVFALGLISPRSWGRRRASEAGFALTLNPLDVDKLMRNRLLAVLFASVYMLVLLLIAEPAAGVMTGALLPPMLVGLADEYTVWAASRSKS
jgi:hypothetical protein